MSRHHSFTLWLKGRLFSLILNSFLFSGCSEFVKVCFEPFSASLVKDGAYQHLEREAEELRGILKEKVDRYVSLLVVSRKSFQVLSGIE